jgi:hypothetical protein
MKIAATIVGTDDQRFRRVTANEERIALAKRIATATQVKVDLVLLPAGFLTASDADEVKTRARELAALFSHCGLLAGVDIDRAQSGKSGGHAGKSRATDKSGKNAVKEYPFWGFATDGGTLKELWQQRSVMPGEAVEDTSGRMVNVGGKDVGVLLCGEIYNNDLRPALHTLKPYVVVDLGHKSMGRRFTYTLLNVADAVGCNVYHTQHVALGSREASQWTSTPNQASWKNDYNWASYFDEDRNGALWAEVKIWDA